MSQLPTFTMPFEPTTIEHLGLKLYVSLPPVIGELVSNAWDADAKKVEISFPPGEIDDSSEVVVRDYGSGGMDAKTLQGAYLPIGRNCRDALGKDTTEGGRQMMGRKGIGKLSAFGVASELQVFTVRAGQSICLRLNYDEMKAWPAGKPYEPKVVVERCGKTGEPDGTEIRLKHFHRRKPISEEWVRRELARRFTVIGNNFQVIVNGKPIAAEDRRLRKDCRRSWDVKDLPDAGIIDAALNFQVQGWIGIVEKSSQTDRGVDIFARGKSVELETSFRLKTTHIQFARAYVVGEIHADFLDADEDNISTARNAALWESVHGQKLEDWGQRALVFVFNEWLAMQKKEKEEKIVSTGNFGTWLSTRNPREQRVAMKLVKAIVEDQNIDSEAAKPLLEIVKTNIEFIAFQDLVDEIEESGASVDTLLRLFRDWRVIEAREHLRLSDGRLEVMEKLADFIERGALEVKQIQPLFEENGWLVNPKWGEVNGQTTYTQLLRKNCKESKDLADEDKRMDILGYEVGGTLHVVELKRSSKTLSRKDLEQIEEYVDWARENIVGTGPDSPKYVSGLLLVGQLNKTKSIADKQTRLAGSDIRVSTYRDLLHTAQKIYGEVQKRLKSLAPEYSKEARKARKASEKTKMSAASLN